MEYSNGKSVRNLMGSPANNSSKAPHSVRSLRVFNRVHC